MVYWCDGGGPALSSCGGRGVAAARGLAASSGAYVRRHLHRWQDAAYATGAPGLKGGLAVNWQDMLDGTLSGSFQHSALRRLGLPNFSGWEPGRVWGEWDVDPEICNPDGALFGGYLAALADATAGHAVATTLDDEEGFATADLYISYYRSVRGGRLRFEGVVVSRGRQIGHVEVRFTSEDGDVLATARATEVVTRGARRRGLGASP